MDINDRILELIQALNMNPTSFSKRLGHSSNSVISSIVSGRRSKPSAETLKQIILTFEDVNGNWLLAGVGDMFISKKANQESENTLENLQRDVTTSALASRVMTMYHDLLKKYKALTDRYNEITKRYNEVIEERDELKRSSNQPGSMAG